MAYGMHDVACTDGDDHDDDDACVWGVSLAV